MGERIIVVGNAGSGKTTLAQQLSQQLNLSHAELDALFWEPNWTPAETAVFRQRVTEITNGDAWILDGNYSKVRDIVWAKADTLIWLDYPILIILWRLLRRGLTRSITRQPLWNDNRETLRGQFLSRDSLFIWALKKQWSHRRKYTRLLEQPECRHLTAVRLQSPRQTKKWLAALADD
ncbi:MAG: adenylate kinase [Chloroflexi bacterium]|nr:adenylate kinase [Chloroflexota bacterium]